MSEKAYRTSKRIFDVVMSIIAVIILIVPWIIISIFIKIQSPGPVIYKARRVGKDGIIFTLYKFRTMNVDSGKIHATTLTGDPRIFQFGKFLRYSKLDETPQLINILKGDMTIIGPRPEDEENASQIYTGKYAKILFVKPGLSSPASLFDYTHGERYPDEESYIKEFIPKKMDVELYYIQHQTAVYDLKIIYRTIVTICLILLGKENFAIPEEATRVGIKN